MKKMKNSLSGKVVIVTGGSGLLGSEIINDIKTKGGIPINFDICLETNLDLFKVKCDITSAESISNCLSLVLNHYGNIDGVVNNAYPRTNDWGASFEEIQPSSLRTNIDWQLNSYIIFCQEAIKLMKPFSRGSIVNMSSIYGVVGNDFTIYEGTTMEPPAAYTAIKGGIINFTRYLASKYGIHGIRINCVSPGGIYDFQPDKFVKAYERKVPMNRMGTPKDIAPAVSFLLSDESNYITGHNLIVDGGYTIK